MTNFVLILADGAVDPISGGAGWAGAGLLGLVLGWLLLKHLPDKDRLIKTLVDEYNARIDGLIGKHEASLESQRAAFRESLDKVSTHCAEEMESTRNGFLREIDSRFRLAGKP